jgi:signal transduction histidine kinase
MARMVGLARPAVRVGVSARHRWRALAHVTQDTLLAAAAVVATTAYYLLNFGFDATFWVAAAMITGTCTPLVLRRRLPLTSAALSMVAVFLGALLVERDTGIVVAFAVIGSAAYHTDRNRWLLTLASVGWMQAYAAFIWPDFHPADLAASLAIGTAPVAFGYALRVKVEQAEQRARLHRARSLQARSEERARIARDVHDIVGHHLSAIRMQAVGGSRALRHAPDKADRAFGTIADTSHRALEEIREMLALLNDVTPAGAVGLDPANLEELAARLAPEQPRITVDVAPGAARDMPLALQVCVYRIVQESLTNVVRHSTAREARVRVEFNEREVVVTVDDNGQPRSAPPTAREGAGVQGMRERVRLLGGSFACGPRAPRGWRVRAVLPCDVGEGR